MYEANDLWCFATGWWGVGSQLVGHFVEVSCCPAWPNMWRWCPNICWMPTNGLKVCGSRGSQWTGHDWTLWTLWTPARRWQDGLAPRGSHPTLRRMFRCSSAPDSKLIRWWKMWAFGNKKQMKRFDSWTISWAASCSNQISTSRFERCEKMMENREVITNPLLFQSSWGRKARALEAIGDRLRGWQAITLQLWCFTMFYHLNSLRFSEPPGAPHIPSPPLNCINICCWKPMVDIHSSTIELSHRSHRQIRQDLVASFASCNGDPSFLFDLTAGKRKSCTCSASQVGRKSPETFWDSKL